jgi:hypothetical protein
LGFFDNFQKLPKENNRPIGENSLNLVTLIGESFIMSSAWKSSTAVIRVTRLGEFGPNGRLLTMGSFPKNTEVAQNFGKLFSQIKH